MTGTVKNIQGKKGYGFIRCNNGEYFFHRDDFLGSWPDLEDRINMGSRVDVEFETVKSPKGLRAANVKPVG